MSGRRTLLPGRALPTRTGVASHSSSGSARRLGVSSHSPLLELLYLSLQSRHVVAAERKRCHHAQARQKALSCYLIWMPRKVKYFARDCSALTFCMLCKMSCLIANGTDSAAAAQWSDVLDASLSVPAP